MKVQVLIDRIDALIASTEQPPKTICLGKQEVQLLWDDMHKPEFRGSESTGRLFFRNIPIFQTGSPTDLFLSSKDWSVLMGSVMEVSSP